MLTEKQKAYQQRRKEKAKKNKNYSEKKYLANKKWYQENQEKVKAQRKRYYEANKEKLNTYVADWAKANPEKTALRNRKSMLKLNFGITLEDYDKMFEEQNGYCAVCGTHQTQLKKSLSVDHCHSTKIIRGLLCHNCNVALGFLKEDIQIIKNLIKYIQIKNKPNLF